jgi:predicted flap endonuclease-1-like 5' DNA nuclease
VAWFIGQSAVMILLAFLLGLLVGWIIWGRRVRALLVEVEALRASVAACEANHGDADGKQAGTAAQAPPAPVHIPAPRAEVTDEELETSSGSHSGGLDMDDHDTFDDADLDDADLDDADLHDSGHDVAELDVAEAELDETDLALAELDAIDVYAANGHHANGHHADGHHVDELVENRAGQVGVADADADLADASVADVAVAELEPADDLVRIEGIGPKIASALAAAGIRTYAVLARASEETLTAAIHAGGIRFAPSLVTWAEQARLLADGDEAAFLALTDRLIAGRDVSKTAKGDDVPPPPPDDFARIEGIGPKIAAALVAAGFRTYAQLADADDEALTKAIKDAGISFAPSLVTWAEQARLLADGDEDAFAVLTARLIAGRRADDDLQRIEGIGPKVAAALHSAGIRTYRALAGSSETRLRNAMSGSGLSFTPSLVTWASQARLLADGDEDGFADLTRRLVAGRDEGRV